MIRATAILRGRRVAFNWTALRHPRNDRLRVVATIFGANDNPLMWGGPAA